MLRVSSKLIFNNNQLFSRSSGIYFLPKWDSTSRRSYAKPMGGIGGLGKKLGKTGPTLEKKILPVVTDPEKLVTHCCGLNILKEGDEIKLKDDSEYPDWLWTLNTGNPPSLEEMDPDTEEYWERARKLSNKRSTAFMRLKKF